MDINNMQEKLVQQNMELMKKQQQQGNEQVLIEDATMAAFGYKNASEVQVKASDKY